MSFYDFLIYWQKAYVKIGVRYFIMAGAAFVLFYFIFKVPMLKRKVQAKFPQNKDYLRDVFFSVISIGIFAAMFVCTFSFLKPYTNIYDNVDEYGVIYYGFSIVWMFFLHDAYFYWSHRLMHHPKVFRHVHLIHHKSTNPSPWTAYAFHPLEGVVEALIIPIIAFSIPTHKTAIISYTFFQIVYNVYGHLGFEIFPKKFHKHWFGKWMNTSVAHNMHHKYFTNNYGLWTTIWDRSIGTMNPGYNQLYEEVTEQGVRVAKPQLKVKN